MNITTLNKSHKNLNAKMVPFAGFEMPLMYSDIKNEVKAVRENCGIFDVSHMGILEVTGEDTTKFIDYLIPNNYLTLKKDKAIYSTLCNEEGKILDDIICYKLEDEYAYIVVNASNVEKDFSWMQKQIINFRCSISQKNNELSLIAVQGPKSFEILEKIFTQNDIASDAPFSLKFLDYNQTRMLMAKTGYTGEIGCEIFVPNVLASEIFQKLLDEGATPCGLASRDVLRLEVCYPLYGNDISEEVTPLDAGLKWTVKLDKEDFIGKNALNSYSPKFKLKKYILNGAIPRQGYEVKNLSGETIGKVTSGTYSPTINEGICMCLINQSVDDKEVQISVRNKLYNCTEIKGNFLKQN